MDNSAVVNNRFEITPHVGGIPLAAFVGGIAFFICLLLAYYVNPLFCIASALLLLPLLYINKTTTLYVYILTFTYTLPIFMLLQAQIRIDDFIFVIIASVWFMDKALNPDVDAPKKIFARPLIIWLIINALSILINLHNFNTHQIIRSGYHLFRMIEYVAVYFIVSDMIKSQKMKITLIRLVWLITLFICLYGLYQYHIGGLIRVTSTLSENHAHIGCFLLLTFFVLIGYISVTRNVLEKILIILTLPLMVYVLFLSASRAGILALAFGALVYFMFMLRPLGWVIAVILVFAIIYMGIDFIQNLQEYELGIAGFQNLERDISLMGRFYIWYEAVDMIRQNPSILITGVGLGAFRAALYPHTPLFAGASGGHNNFLHHLTETGILGLAIFIYILYILLRESLHRARQPVRDDKTLYYGYFCGLAALVLTAITQETFSVQVSLHNILGYFFLVTALIFSEPTCEQEKTKN